MASQIAYAPRFDADNTLFGQLSQAAELNQRLQSQRVQQKMMEQQLSQGAQEFPLQLQAIQADTAMKQQQLKDAQAMSGSKVDAAAQEVNLLKAHVSSAQVAAQNAQKLTDMQLKLDDLAANRETITNSFLGRQERQKLDIGNKQAQALGLSNEAQQANNNVLSRMLDQKLKSGEIGMDQQKASLQQTLKQTDQISAQLQMMQSDHEMRAIDQLSKLSESDRNVMVDQSPDIGVFQVFKKNRELLNDQHMMNFKDLLEKNIMLDPTLGSARLPPDTMGMVLGPDGKTWQMGSTRDINRNAYKQILDKTTGVIQKQMGNVTAASKALKLTSDNNLYGSSVISSDKADQLGGGESQMNYSQAKKVPDMKAAISVGDDTLARSFYHATQQRGLDKQPLAQAAAYPEYKDMLAKQPLSGIVDNGFAKDVEGSNADNYTGYRLNPTDQTTLKTYMNAASAIGLDPQKTDQAKMFGYDPDAKVSQVLKFRALVDTIARAKADYVNRQVGTTAINPESGMGNSVNKDAIITNPKQMELAQKIYGNSTLLAGLTPLQHQALVDLGYKMGMLNPDGSPKTGDDTNE
jgi:hypothetical protein